MANPLTKIRHVLDLVKFSHTLFALPFALASLIVAVNGFPSFRLLILILLAMVTARTSAMAFNRYLDADIDAKNPRTVSRHIPAGLLSRNFVLMVTIVNAVLFVGITYFINELCFYLSLPALFVLFFYSATKRFTSWAHFVLGLALGISPVGAWIAARGSLDLAPIILSLAVLCWVAGFDIIYATQDHEFDRQEGLHSVVSKYGVGQALLISRLLHGATVLLLGLFGKLTFLGTAYWVGLLLIAGLLAYEQSLIRANDLSRVNAAFFNVNGIISLLFLLAVAISIF